MENFEAFKIEFAGLKESKHIFNYHIDNSFFELFDYHKFNAVDADVELILDKKENVLELQFNLEGSVNVYCDVSRVPYDQPIDTVLELVVKFGDDFNDEDEEMLILPLDEIRLQVQQYIYEAIILAVPQKKVHPGVEDGTLESDVLDKLEELSPGNQNDNKEETDPRWDKLKDLLNEK